MDETVRIWAGNREVTRDHKSLSIAQRSGWKRYIIVGWRLNEHGSERSSTNCSGYRTPRCSLPCCSY